MRCVGLPCVGRGVGLKGGVWPHVPRRCGLHDVYHLGQAALGGLPTEVIFLQGLEGPTSSCRPDSVWSA
jgi:hypothetical protein